ncbi:MAG: hypothetical protein KME40_14840 [Komarekiella atlantica HA4396-MV6]|jgi:hypothetical protein|nr:hypothetical protein [Komarekiella atlantica HA4396-MV6]
MAVLDFWLHIGIMRAIAIITLTPKRQEFLPSGGGNFWRVCKQKQHSGS